MTFTTTYYATREMAKTRKLLSHQVGCSVTAAGWPFPTTKQYCAGNDNTSYRRVLHLWALASSLLPPSAAQPTSSTAHTTTYARCATTTPAAAAALWRTRSSNRPSLL